MNRVVRIRLAIVSLLSIAALFVYLWPEGDFSQGASVSRNDACEDGMLCVHFLDVGQGDAILIESPAGVEVLIDGGPGGSVLQGLSDALGFFDRDIDIAVATHPDQDHIGGLIDVLERYAVGAIVMTENKNDTNVSGMFDTYADNEGAEIIYARAGQIFDLGIGEAGSTTLSILFPDRDPTGFEGNTASIVARLSYGDTDFLLTGDAPATVEGFLVETYGNGLQSEVLKVGHHGSRTSTSEDFLMTVAPEYAVISAGKDNSYGHPHVEVTDLVFNHRVEIKNTAEDGSIIFESNGTQLWLK
jgi:competence protein ComEC